MQILVEGTNSNTAALVSSYAGEIVVARFALTAGWHRRSPARGGHSRPRRARTRVWFNPDLKSRNYFVPGVIANIIMMVTLMLTALAIVREKEIGTMEQLMVTPIRPIELMIGKTLPFAVVGLLDVALITTAALRDLSRIPLRGSLLLLLANAVLFLLTSLGAGLFISTISQTQQQAMMSSFFFAMPCFMLSGFAFPIHNMPIAVQYLTYLNPLRYFVEIVRGIFLKGTGIAVLWPQTLALGGLRRGDRDAERAAISQTAGLSGTPPISTLLRLCIPLHAAARISARCSPSARPAPPGSPAASARSASCACGRIRENSARA